MAQSPSPPVAPHRLLRKPAAPVDRDVCAQRGAVAVERVERRPRPGDPAHELPRPDDHEPVHGALHPTPGASTTSSPREADAAACAASTTGRASRCPDVCSIAPARRAGALGERGQRDHAATAGWPIVSVPVLSKSTTDAAEALQRARRADDHLSPAARLIPPMHGDRCGQDQRTRRGDHQHRQHPARIARTGRRRQRTRRAVIGVNQTATDRRVAGAAPCWLGRSRTSSTIRAYWLARPRAVASSVSGPSRLMVPLRSRVAGPGATGAAARRSSERCRRATWPISPRCRTGPFHPAGPAAGPRRRSRSTGDVLDLPSRWTRCASGAPRLEGARPPRWRRPAA